MKLESSFEFGESFYSLLSQEERNFFEAFRFTSWTGKPLKFGERRVAQYYSRSGLRWESAGLFSEDVRGMFTHAFSILSRVFEKEGKRISKVDFIQEKRPDKGGRTIENTYAGEWHHHRRNAIGKGKSTLVVLADRGSTEFARGTLEIGEKQFDVHEKAVEALKEGGTLTPAKLSSGRVVHFDKNTIHRRGNFEEDGPRVVLLIEYED